MLFYNITELTPLTAISVMKDCGFNCNKWHEVGVILEAPLTSERNQKSIDTFEMLEEILEWWITNGQQQPSWDKLISAVEKCGEKEIADKMRKHCHSDTTPPTSSTSTSVFGSSPIPSQQAQINTKGSL